MGGRKGGNPDIRKTSFVKGDPRINRKGQPRKLPSLDKLLPEVLGDSEQENSKIKKILTALGERALRKGGDRAAEILLDRGYGKAKEHITVDVEGRKNIGELFPVVEKTRGKK